MGIVKGSNGWTHSGGKSVVNTKNFTSQHLNEFNIRVGSPLTVRQADLAGDITVTQLLNTWSRGRPLTAKTVLQANQAAVIGRRLNTVAEALGITVTAAVTINYVLTFDDRAQEFFAAVNAAARPQRGDLSDKQVIASAFAALVGLEGTHTETLAIANAANILRLAFIPGSFTIIFRQTEQVAPQRIQP